MLTERQKEILKANGISPTVRNICDLSGLKFTGTVHAHLSNLKSQGYITKIETVPRSITITEKGFKQINIK